MKNLLIFAFLLCLNINLFAQVNGNFEEIDGEKVLTIWGTHQERGYAHGYLMGLSFKDLFDNYIVKYYCNSSSQTYNNIRSFFTDNYSIEVKYQSEADAMIQGMIDNGVDLYNQILGRDIDATDIFIVTALPDLFQAGFEMPGLGLGCSSISSWGNSTLQDSTLSGHLVLTRLMDWENHAGLNKNHLLIVNIPSEEDEQKWVSIAFAGFLGSLSGINESGLAAFMNIGNKTSFQSGDPFYPILLTVRNGIEADDYNQDTENTPADVVQAVQDRNRSGASIIHIVKDEGVNSSPIIIECNNVKGISIRNMSNNTLVPGENLVATNHFRTLYSPVSCYRYNGIVNSLNSSTEISPEISWKILEDSAGLPGNLHAIQYIASSNLLKWAASTSSSLAYSQEPTQFYLDDLFSYQTDVISLIHIGAFLIYPNPTDNCLNLVVDNPEPYAINIISINGQLLFSQEMEGIQQQINLSFLQRGIYFITVRSKDGLITKKFAKN